MSGDIGRLNEFAAMNDKDRAKVIKQMSEMFATKKQFSADLIAQIISEDARVENGKVANVGYLAVKIAETLEKL